MQYRSVALWSCLLVLQLGGPVVAQSDSPALAQADSPPPDPARFAEEIEAFEQQDRLAPPAENAILFVGSSSIRLWDLQRWLPGYPVINRGFGGSVMNDSLHFVDRIVTNYQPRIVVVYAGDNDVARGMTPEQIARDFSEFARRVRQIVPTARLVYVSIKPSIARWQMYPRMAEANQKMRQMAAADATMEFLDVATPMLGDDGQPRPELFIDDGLHLSAKGYQLWTDLLRPLLGVGE